MRKLNTVLVTGGAGFIGSAVVRQFINETDITVVNVDALTYAGNLESLASIADNPRYHFEHANICDKTAMERIFREHQPDAVMHLAAESHVDRSIDGPAEFIETNIIGTYTLLDVARQYWQARRQTQATANTDSFIFHHISTDEVFGSLGDAGLFTEASQYQPNSPYSASKASSDHLVRAWHHTYGLPVVITNCSNNYGPYQFPEKLIPLTILNATAGKPIPVYGQGDNVRDWLYVDDHANALRRVLESGTVGKTYNIGGHIEKTNLEVVHAICQILDELLADSEHRPHADLITYVDDRPGHDQRYAIDASKIDHELGWKPSETFESGLMKTVQWYLQSTDWCMHVQDGSYAGAVRDPGQCSYHHGAGRDPGHPHVIPAQAGIQGTSHHPGAVRGPGQCPHHHGAGRNPGHPHVIPAQAGIQGTSHHHGAGRGPGHPHVIPAQAGIQGTSHHHGAGRGPGHPHVIPAQAGIQGTSHHPGAVRDLGQCSHHHGAGRGPGHPHVIPAQAGIQNAVEPKVGAFRRPLDYSLRSPFSLPLGRSTRYALMFRPSPE